MCHQYIHIVSIKYNDVVQSHMMTHDSPHDCESSSVFSCVCVCVCTVVSVYYYVHISLTFDGPMIEAPITMPWTFLFCNIGIHTDTRYTSTFNQTFIVNNSSLLPSDIDMIFARITPISSSIIDSMY